MGDYTTATVTILKSDYPNGKFVFQGQTTIMMDNTDKLKQQVLAIERTGGLSGQQTVSTDVFMSPEGSASGTFSD